MLLESVERLEYPDLELGGRRTGHITPWNSFGNHMLLPTEGMTDTME